MTDRNKAPAYQPHATTGVRRKAKLLEANEHLVVTSVKAQEEADSARSAQLASEEVQTNLRNDAAFRERLIGVIGHDLRNPLNTISMAAGLLTTSETLAASDAQLASSIVRSALRMKAIIAQVLDFTRARLGGGFPLSASIVDLSDVCNQIVAELRLAASAQIDVSTRGDVTGNWDASLLGEMISNLAGNAIEHASPSTPVWITVVDAGAEVVVEIGNMGPTIPQDAIATLFDPFRRADSLSRPRDHLGLGLYIVHEIVRSHLGRINVSSVADKTCFTVRLPRVRDAAHAQVIER